MEKTSEKLLNHVMKVLERVIEMTVRNRVNIDGIGLQLGFSPRKVPEMPFSF